MVSVKWADNWYAKKVRTKVRKEIRVFVKRDGLYKRSGLEGASQCRATGM